MTHLAAATARVAEKVRLARQNALLRARDHEGEGLDSLGVSPAMRELARQIELLAASDRSTVLLAGESGTGKGWAARIVHRSEEHTSELQSLAYLVCRLLLEKKKVKQHVQSGS